MKYIFQSTKWRKKRPQAGGSPTALAVKNSLPSQNQLHLARKLWHALVGIGIAGSYAGGISRQTEVSLLGSLLALDLTLEFWRLQDPQFNQKILRIWKPLMRKSELDGLSGIASYLFSCTFAIFFFPKTIAIVSILYLACGDPFASLAGILYGNIGPKLSGNKSLVGSLAGTVTCIFVGFLYLKFFSEETSSAKIAFFGGCAGGIAELLPLKCNDNMTIPIVSGFSLWFFWHLF